MEILEWSKSIEGDPVPGLLIDWGQKISVYEEIKQPKLISRDQGRIISEIMILKEEEIGIMMMPNVWPIYTINIGSLLKFIDTENSRDEGMKPPYLDKFGSLFLNVIHNLQSPRPNYQVHSWILFSLKGYFKGTKLFSDIFFLFKAENQPESIP